MEDFKNTKEGRAVAQKYSDILPLSRPEPPVKHPRMALSNRAKIFSPFAALRGFDDEISSEGASKLLVKNSLMRRRTLSPTNSCRSKKT